MQLSQQTRLTGRPLLTPRGCRRPARGTKEERAADREEQFKLQQEVLKARKSGNWQDKVKARRAIASRYMRDSDFKKEVDEERRQRIKAEKANEEERTGFRFIIPVAPFGMPEYDGGERFDLRAPYVDNGYVDEDADFFNNVKKFFSRKQPTQPENPPKKGRK